MLNQLWIQWRLFGCGLLLLILAACNSTPAQQDATPAATYVQLGMHYFKEGEYKAALIKLKRALEIDPHSADAHGGIAILYEQLGNLELAGEHYQRAVQANPSDPGLQNNYGAYLCKVDRYQEAEAHFMAAIKDPLYSTPEVAHTNAGICARKNNDMVGAEQHFRAALRFNTKFADALAQMVRLSYDQRNYLSARAFLQRYQIERALDASLLWLAILIEQALGDQASMASYILSLRTQYPESPEAQKLALLEQQQLHTRIERAAIVPVNPAQSPAQAVGIASDQPLPTTDLKKAETVMVLPEPVQPLLSAPSPAPPSNPPPAAATEVNQAEPPRVESVKPVDSAASPAVPVDPPPAMTLPDITIPAPTATE